VRLLAILLAAWPAVVAPQVVLNEVASANLDTVLDIDGEAPDWIEIYNRGPSPVDLTDCGLSDERDEPRKWTFPPMVIEAGAHLVVFASGASLGVGHWETVIDRGDVWAYLPGDSPLPEGWASPSLDDSWWSRGPSGFGFGDGDDATETPKELSLYARIQFSIADPGSIIAALLHVDYDDAFVAYVNGEEVARSPIGRPGVPPSPADPAQLSHEAALYRGLDPEHWWVDDLSVFVAGENLLAIEVHNISATDDDLTLIPFLTLGSRTAPPGATRGAAEELVRCLPRLRTSFRLDAEGESVVLSSPGGEILDAVDSPRLFFGVSYGRAGDGGEEWGLLAEPTPGAPNPGQVLAGHAATPELSLPGGLYSDAIEVGLAGASPDSTVRFTLDSSEPTPDSQAFEGPIRIARTTVLRARGFAPGLLESRIATRTFVIAEPHDLPVVSLVTEASNLWDPGSGILVPANRWSEREVPVHLELFEEGGASTAVDVDAGLKVHGGGGAVDRDQASLRVNFRGGWGVSILQHRVFPDSEVEEFSGLVLRNSGQDWCRTQFRDGLMHRIASGWGVDGQAFRPAVVYLNGDYWGMLNLRERHDHEFLAAHHGLDPEAINLVEGTGWPVRGSSRQFREMIRFIERSSLAEDTNLDVVRSMMDVDQFATYSILQIFFANTDWPGNNVELWRSTGGGGRWRWILFDTDFGLGLAAAADHDTLAFATDPDGPEWPNPPWSTFLLRSLLENESFRRSFANRYADLLNSALSPSRVHALATAIEDDISSEIPRHFARWGRPAWHWWARVRQLREWVDRRPGAARDHLQRKFGLRGRYLLSLRASPPEGGWVDLEAISVAEEWSGVYFRGNPVTLSARPAPGHRFVGWSDPTLPQEPSVVIDPPGDYKLIAFFTP